MATYTIQLAGVTKTESVSAAEHSISPEGELILRVRDNNGVASIVAVFARGQWQFMRVQ